MLNVTPFLWFEDNLEGALEFYRSVFPDMQVKDVRRYTTDAPGQAGKVMTATFSLLGREFMALNGGPHFKFTEAISMFVECDTQKEVDELWAKLSAGGVVQQCGWLKDRFGLSWQIIPRVLGQLLSDPDPAKSKRAMQAMLGMKKLDIAALRAAHAG